MDEIIKHLFRGQTRRKGEKIKNFAGEPMDSNWVYGGIFAGAGDYSIIYTYEPLEKRTVYTDTICRYVGMTDMNETMIFEQDIVQHEDYGIGVVVWNDKCARFEIEFVDDGSIVDFDHIHEKHLVVIGNKFDNPELLES